MSHSSGFVTRDYSTTSTTWPPSNLGYDLTFTYPVGTYSFVEGDHEQRIRALEKRIAELEARQSRQRFDSQVFGPTVIPMNRKEIDDGSFDELLRKMKPPARRAKRRKKRK